MNDREKWWERVRDIRARHDDDDKYTVCQKHFYFKQFNQTIVIQTIQFSISIDLVYTQLNVKRVLFQTIQFNIQKQFHFKQSSLV